MIEANWQEQTLQQYYPEYLPKKTLKLIFKQFSDWHKKINNQERFKDALRRVRGIKPGNNNNDTEDLIHHILVICFLAKHGNKYDDSKRIRNEWKELGENIETQKRLIREITKLLKKSSASSAEYSILIPKDNLSTDTKKLLAPPDPNLANYLWSPDFVENILTAYSIYLKNAFGKPSKEIEVALPFETKLGALLYPKKPFRQSHRSNLQENSLFYNLAFLFSHFTKKSRGYWLPATEGTITKKGKPNYSLISELANAVFYPTAKEVSEENEFNPSKVRDRVLSLTKANVKLGCWFGL